jgi:hypothetical protein
MPRVSRALPTNPFARLPSELVREIIKWTRCDPLGNETIPGHVAATQLRGTNRLLRDENNKAPSELDGGWEIRSFDNEFNPNCSFDAISHFHGGKRVSELLEEHDGSNLQLFIVRDPSTGAIKALTMLEDVNDGMMERYHEIDLKGLVQTLSFHNADFEKRLRFCDEVVMGKKIRVKSRDIASTLQRQSVDAEFLDADFGSPTKRPAGRTRHSDYFVSFKTTLRAARADHEFNRYSYHPTIVLQVQPASIVDVVWRIEVPVDASGEYEWHSEVYAPKRTKADEKRKTLTPLSILLGYYDTARVAECRNPTGRWLTSLYRIGTDSELIDTPTWANPSAGLRTRADQALKQAGEEDQLAAATAQNQGRLILYHRPSNDEHERRLALHKQGGPVAAVACPRAAANKARKQMKPMIKLQSAQYRSGRLPFNMHEDPNMETRGILDDRFATEDAEGEDREEEEEEDADYVPKRSRAPSPVVCNKKQNIEALRRLVVVSDDDEDDDEAPAVDPLRAYKSEAVKKLGGLWDL